MSSAFIKPGVKFVSVALDKGLDKLLDYQVPEGLESDISIGMRVVVPLRSHQATGTIIDIKTSSPYAKVLPFKKLLSDDSFLLDDQIKLAHWVSSYYCSPLRKVLKLFVPSSIREKSKPKEQYFIKPCLSLEKLKDFCLEIRSKFPAQAKILDIMLKYPKGLLLTELLELSKTSKAPVETLIKKNLLIQKKMQLDRSELEEFEFFQSAPKTLNNEQANALASIKGSIDKKTHHTHLLFGITGSGKTEVYLQAIDYVRSQNKSVIFMVPEISLTTQTIERLKTRFSEKIAILHHRLSHGERYDMWHNIRQGKVSIVIGARSCIFAPLKNIGLIIVDEEHDGSYKQSEENPCYQARDLAIVRASYNNAVTILGSATPSLESYTHARSGKYTLNTLTNRAASKSCPTVHIIDMNHEKEKSKGYTLFSQQLLSAIEKRLKLGEQTLLFLNRRGYHSILLCSSCEKAQSCPHCDVSLTYHKKDHIACCHYCGFTLSPPPKKCLTCHKDTLEYKGVGTEKVEATLKAILKNVKTLRMDADTTRHKGSHDRIYRDFRSGKADVLIGTQMVSKGFDFPNVTLVGILNSDSALHIADFRAEETCFQLLTQVSGRSGRSDLEGEVLIQTYLKDHPLFSYTQKNDYKAFYDRELSHRELFNYPPYIRLARILFRGEDPEKTLDYAKWIHSQLVQKLPKNTFILPVISAFRAKIQDLFRYYFLIKSPSMTSTSKVLKETFEKTPPPQSIRYLIDIDPIQNSF